MHSTCNITTMLSWRGGSGGPLKYSCACKRASKHADRWRRGGIPSMSDNLKNEYHSPRCVCVCLCVFPWLHYTTALHFRLRSHVLCNSFGGSTGARVWAEVSSQKISLTCKPNFRVQTNSATRLHISRLTCARRSFSFNVIHAGTRPPRLAGVMFPFPHGSVRRQNIALSRVHNVRIIHTQAHITQEAHSTPMAAISSFGATSYANTTATIITGNVWSEQCGFYVLCVYGQTCSL